MTTDLTTPPTYPMRPMDGGLFTAAPNQLRYNPPPAFGLSEHQAAARCSLWRFEPKLNGWRALVNDKDGTMFNRHGQQLSIQGEFKAALDELEGSGGVCPWWDCEALERRHNIGKGSLILLDWVTVSETHTRDDRYPERRGFMETWGQPFDWQEPNLKEDQLYVIPSFDFDTAMKFWVQAPIINEMLGCTFYEGLVAKRVTSTYKVQLRSDDEHSMDWIKHRFTTLP